MKDIYLYNFYKAKYGKELLIDLVDLNSIKNNIKKNPVHRLSYYDITFITQGGGEEVSINGDVINAKPSMALCSIPGDVWEWNSDTKLEGYVLVFEEEFLLSFFNDAFFLQNFPYLQSSRVSSFLKLDTILFDRVIRLLVQIKNEINIDSEKDQHMLRALLYELLILLNRSETLKTVTKLISRKQSENRYLRTFIEMVKSNYIEDRNIQNYADRICITPNYLNKITRKALGLSPKKYIEQKIVEESKRLLIYTTQSISEIADKLNFSSLSYFVRFFHKHTGTTPLEFRNNEDS